MTVKSQLTALFRQMKCNGANTQEKRGQGRVENGSPNVRNVAEVKVKERKWEVQFPCTPSPA